MGGALQIWVWLLGLVGSLKSALSQKWINKMSQFFACWKVKSYFLGPLAIAGGVLWNRVWHTSVFPSEKAFVLEFFRYFFLNFGLVLQTHIRLSVTEPDIPEKKIYSKNWENGPKTVLNLLKKIVIDFYWISPFFFFINSQKYKQSPQKSLINNQKYKQSPSKISNLLNNF